MKYPRKPPEQNPIETFQAVTELAARGTFAAASLALRGLLADAAEKLDIGQGKVEFVFRRQPDGKWMWEAFAEVDSQRIIGAPAENPIEAVRHLLEQ